MIELALNGMQKFYGASKILENITFDIQTSEKVGIIGRNGTGKSTILKIIAGIESNDGGSVILKKESTIGYLDQIPEYPKGYTVADVLNTAFKNQENIREELKELEGKMTDFSGKDLEIILKKYGELQQKFEHTGGYEIEEKLSKVCTGLNIGEKFKNNLFINLSGGEKTTVILGKILLQSPDILLLDEPSNHLDMEAVEWLEGFLKEYKGSALVVSHDRYFLDSVVTKIVEIEDMECETYNGNYSYYLKEKDRRMMLQFEAYEDQKKKINAMEKTIKQLRDWGSQRADNPKFIRRAESMEKRLAKIERVEKPVIDRKNMKIDFNKTGRSGNEVIKLKEVTKGFCEKTLLHKADLLVRYGERVAIIGKNGCGKSTLIKLLTKEYSEDGGSAEFGASVKLGYLPQNVDFPKEDITVLECFRHNKTISEGNARGFLAKFMFYGESVFKKVKNLSGGEKSRLKLSLILYEDTNVLILDEPTNHLDIDSRETLEEALSEFQGTILFVSHDRYFINVLCTRLVELRDKKLISYNGNYDYYKEKRKAEKCLEEKSEVKAKTISKKEKPKTKNVVNENKKREIEIKKLEDKISQLEDSATKLDNLMAENSSDYEKLNELFKEKSKIQKELEIVMEKWANY
ncbi:ribosomal protection-like ABC-F family protein [Haloimpatiens sp. FM7315]|uniref:ribosomal protection-like ABC-F family protein n=1 Tax=Haloimpatiens sp. FM7315 TaxID=3298609 RepID=UPI003709FA26